MDSSIHDLPFDAASLHGVSATLLRSHHANNYNGTVERLKALRARLAATPLAVAPGFELAGLKREELIGHEFDVAARALLQRVGRRRSGHGARHGAGARGELRRRRAGARSSWRWARHWSAARAGLLTFQPREGTLVNQWAADHTQAIAGAVLVLALDRYEHAYHIDFGAAAAAGAYVDAPLLVLDVFEHAYYLKDPNRRGEYLSGLFNIVNGDNVAERFDAVRT